MNRRRLMLLGFAALIVAYTLAVFRVSRHEAAASRRGGSRTVIRFAHWQLEAGMREAFDTVARRYMELHPEVSVEQFAVPGNVYEQWLRTQLAGDDVPDLAANSIIEQAKLAQLPRYFRPITRWMNEPNPYNAGTRLAAVPWRLTFVDGGRNRATYVDQYREYFAAGISTQTMRLFYNRDLLREITGTDEPPKDFRAWLELGKKVRAHRAGLAHVAGSHDNFTWTVPTLVNQSLSGWLLASDHELRFATSAFDFFGDMLEGGWTLRSPPAQRGLRLMQAFGNEMTPGFLQLSRDSAMRAFLRGEALELPTGTWDYPTMRATARFSIGAFRLPLPTPEDDEFGGYALVPMSDGGLSTALPFYLTRRSRHPEVAIDFLRFLTSIEGNTLFSRASHWMPAVEGVEIAEELRQFAGKNDGYMVTDAHNAPMFVMGAGEEYSRLFSTNLHVLYAPNGGVDAYTRVLEAGARDAVKKDLAKQLRVIGENVRRQDLALAALSELGAAEQAEAARQQSSLNLTEVQMYLAEARLRRGSLEMEAGR